MTVSSEESRWEYTGNGTQTTFEYKNKIYSKTDLVVYVAGVLKTVDIDYTVTNVGVPTGGNVVFGTPPANGALVVIFVDLPITQLSNFVDGDKLPAEALEDCIDRVVKLAQTFKETLKKTFKIPISSALGNIEVPIEANKFLRWNALGTNIETVDIENVVPGGQDLSDYAKLAGRANGQTLIGGTAVTDILRLQGTSGNGTATSPAIQLRVGNAGATAAMTVLNNGNVGIGTTNPGAKLDIVGTTSLQNQLRVVSVSGQIPNSVVFQDGGSSSYIGIPANAAGLNHHGSGDFVISNQVVGNHLLFGTEGSEKMRITSVGNVGIGLTNPGARLSIFIPNLTNLTPYYHIGQGLPAKDGVTIKSPVITTADGYINLASEVFSEDTTGANQVAIQASIRGNAPGAYIWSINPVVVLTSAMTTGAALGIEVDINNDGFNATAANPVWGVQISGIGTKRNFAALGIAGASWKYGIGFFNNAMAGGDAYFMSGDTAYPSYGLDFRTGVFGSAAIALANTNKISWTDSGGTLRQALQVDGNNNLVLGGTGLGGVKFGPGSFSAGVGKIYTHSAYGLVITPDTGTSYDFTVTDIGGTLVLGIVAGTNDLAICTGGQIRYGTYTARGAESFAGFITMKDAGGTSRKIMICS